MLVSKKREAGIVYVLPRVKDTAKQDDGSQSSDNLFVAFCPRVEGEHTYGSVHTIDYHH